MFKSKGTAGTSEPTVIGKGTVVEGTVRVSGRVQIDGQIDGTVIAEGHVSIGPEGSVLGEIAADELAVGGRVEGKISVRGHLHIAPNGVARGDMRYGSLQVDRGGVIDGNTVREGEGADATGSTTTSPVGTSGRPVSVVS
ncbi:MAG: polymer-forming cytoskeletal protein [Polyangiales bacterium]